MFLVETLSENIYELSKKKKIRKNLLERIYKTLVKIKTFVIIPHRPYF
jgi:hypothetical protein